MTAHDDDVLALLRRAVADRPAPPPAHPRDSAAAPQAPPAEAADACGSPETRHGTSAAPAPRTAAPDPPSTRTAEAGASAKAAARKRRRSAAPAQASLFDRAEGAASAVAPARTAPAFPPPAAAPESSPAEASASAAASPQPPATAAAAQARAEPSAADDRPRADTPADPPGSGTVPQPAPSPSESAPCPADPAGGAARTTGTDAAPAAPDAGCGRDGATGARGGDRPSRQDRRRIPARPGHDRAGHRSRLRARLERAETLADYELAELLLFRSIPVQDTKPVAKALIKRFGSFAAALSAPPAQLREVRGVGDAVIADFRIVRAAAERLALGEIKGRETLASTDAVVAYFRTKLRGAEREEFHVLFLDKKNGFLASEQAQVGTVDHTPVYPREVLKRAVEIGASAVVLVHNHPSGDPAPSKADVAMTGRIVEALAPVEITVHDHLVIGANGYTSLRSAGLM